MYWVSWLELLLTFSSRSLFTFWMVTSSLFMLMFVCLMFVSNDLILSWETSRAFLVVINSFFTPRSSSSAEVFAAFSLLIVESLSKTSFARSSSSFSRRWNSVCKVRFSSLIFFSRSFRFFTSSLKLSRSFLRLFVWDSVIASLCVLLLSSVSKVFLCVFKSFISFSSSWIRFSSSPNLRSKFFLSDLRFSTTALVAITSRFTSANSFCNFFSLSFSSAITLSFFTFAFFSPSLTFSCWLTFTWWSLIVSFAFTFLWLASFKLFFNWAIWKRAATSLLSKLSIFAWILCRSSSAFSLSFSAASKSFSFCARSVLATVISRSRSVFSLSTCARRSCKVAISSLAASSCAFRWSTSLPWSLSSSFFILAVRFLISLCSCAVLCRSFSSWLSFPTEKLLNSW